MTKITFDITTSLDGYVAGPNQSVDEPLGEGGEALHEWAFALEAWRKPHGREGGETTASSALMEEGLARTGAVVMGRKMFGGGGTGPWGDEPWEGWWGDDPPFHVPVFVVTHHPREKLEKEGGTTFTFVTDGIKAAVEQARSAAGGKDVSIGGGADVIQQALQAGLVDEFQVNVAPVLLGSGTSLFGEVGTGELAVEPTGVVEAPAVTHLRYRVVK